MSIKLYCKKVITGSLEYAYKVEKVEALGLIEVPKAYLREKPYCYSRAGGLVINEKDSDFYHLYDGQILDIQEMSIVLSTIEKCGDRLREINQKRKDMAKEWSGNIEIRI